MNLAITLLGITVTLIVACLWAPFEILIAAGESFTVSIGVTQLTAVAVGLVGLYMLLWTAAAFLRQGEGTPIPVQPPKQLVIFGFYRYVRNPMYIGFLLVLLAESIYFVSPSLLAYAVAVAAALHLYLFLIEEPALVRRFGAEYIRYKRAVPRWIPRLRTFQSNQPL